jgi:hypothetical protein
MSSGNERAGDLTTTTLATGDWRPAAAAETLKEWGASPATHDLFVVGRISKGERRLLFPHSTARAPFPGPWELRAVFAR